LQILKTQHRSGDEATAPSFVSAKKGWSEICKGCRNTGVVMDALPRTEKGAKSIEPHLLFIPRRTP